MDITNFFSKIFVINLPERTDRREEIEHMFKKFGIDANSIEFFPAVKPSSPDGFRTIGARGCFMSHLHILEKAKEENLDSILIIEDDLDLNKNFTLFQKDLLEALSHRKWDIVYFGHELNVPHEKNAFFADYTQDIMLAHFLGFAKKAIQKLVPFLHGLLKEPQGSPKGGPMDVDGAYSTFRAKHPEIITLVSIPSLGGQRSSRSDVTDNKWFDRPGILRTISSKLRKIKQFLKKAR